MVGLVQDKVGISSALVACPATPFFDRQSRLCPIQRLNLALLIHAEHHCLLRRIRIQAHHIGHLLRKLRIARQFESLRAMRLQLMGAPDIVDRGLADALALRHGAATPVRHPRRFGLQGSIHDGGDLIDSMQGFSSPARSNTFILIVHRPRIANSLKSRFNSSCHTIFLFCANPVHAS